MEKNRLEAESKLLCKKFGADSLGATWVAALLPEFKKSYVEEVRLFSNKYMNDNDGYFQLVGFIAAERLRYTVYPPGNGHKGGR